MGRVASVFSTECRTPTAVNVGPRQVARLAGQVGYGQVSKRDMPKQQPAEKKTSKKLTAMTAARRQRVLNPPAHSQVSFDDLLSSVNSDLSSGQKKNTRHSNTNSYLPSTPFPSPTLTAAFHLPSSKPHPPTDPETTPVQALPAYQLRSCKVKNPGCASRMKRRKTFSGQSSSKKNCVSEKAPPTRHGNVFEGGTKAAIHRTGPYPPAGDGGSPGNESRVPLKTDVATGQWENPTPNNSPTPTKTNSSTRDNMVTSSLDAFPMISPGPPHPPKLPSPPLVASTSPFSPTATLPPAQRQLAISMECPLPLPPWLLTSMTKVQYCSEHTQTHISPELKKKKKKNRK